VRQVSLQIHPGHLHPTQFKHKFKEVHLEADVTWIVAHKEAGDPCFFEHDLLVTHFLVELGDGLHVVLLEFELLFEEEPFLVLCVDGGGFG